MEIVNELCICQYCNQLIPRCKISHHQRSREQMCQLQHTSRYITWRNIYVECVCGTFCLQRTLKSHFKSKRHLDFLVKFPNAIHHPLLTPNYHIPGGNIQESNERVYRHLISGREFILQLIQIDNHSHVQNIIHEDHKVMNVEEKNQESYFPTFFMEFIKNAMNGNFIGMECMICYENIDSNNLFLLPCFHMICKECQTKMKIKRCPSCRKEY